jgi:plastocyanin domain-containing protein
MFGQRLAFALVVVLAAGASACKGKAGGTGGDITLSPGAVQVTADENGFKPSSVTFKKGAPASLVFVRTSDETCATEVVFPELNVKKDLPKGKPVTIDIPTDKDQKLTFQCGMGMYKSAVVVN